MTGPDRRSAIPGFYALSTCLLGGHKIRYYCVALCFGLLLIIRRNLFNHQDGLNFGGRGSLQMTNQNGSQIPRCYDHTTAKRTSISKSNGSDFQPVEVNSYYVYSAYLDDREAPDVDSRALPVVRIFTALPRNKINRAKRTWHCLFWYEAVDKPLVVPVTGVTDLNSFDTWGKIMCIMVLCSVPTNLTNNSPTAVSLVSDISKCPQNHLPITDMRTLRRNFERLSSTTNEDWSQSDDISNFTICIPPLFGDFLTTAELIEFIELNRLLGADKFVVYLESPREEILSCLRYYSRVGLVELNNWSFPCNLDGIHYHGQIVAQNECLYRTMYRTKFIINQDLDEFVIPTRTKTWKEMLDLIHKNVRPGERDRTASYSFRNLFFPLDAASDSSVKEPFKVGEYELKTMTKTICADKSNPWKERSKVMGRPERLLIWHVHEILDSSLVRKGDVNRMIDEIDGLLFHYRKLASHRSSTTNHRMWVFQKELIAGVISRSWSPG